MAELPNDDPLLLAVRDTADRLASGLEYRIEHLAEKEKRVRDSASWDTLPNMPARLIWEAFEPGSAAFFVVYKLIHEARSELPKVYRGIAWALCASQPKRFGLVTYREQLWDALAALDYWPEDGSLFRSEDSVREFVVERVRARGRTDWWSCRASDQEKEASWITEKLLQKGTVRDALTSIRRLQVFNPTAFAAGNVILRIPHALDSLVERICSEASQGKLPELAEIQDRIVELARAVASSGEPATDRNQSIPFDLLTMEADGHLHLIALARESAPQAKKEELRRVSLYLRFFGHYAFGTLQPQDLTVALAFYADKSDRFAEWSATTCPMFHTEELWSFDQFWDYVSGRPNGGELIDTLTAQAAEKLRSQNLTSKLRSFVGGRKRPVGQSSTEQLVRAYLSTSYIVHVDDRKITLRPGLHSAEFDGILGGAGVRAWACISAYNPRSQLCLDHENARLHSELVRVVRDARYKTLSGYGMGDDGSWPAERCLFVLGIGRDEARRLGARFGQNAILVGEVGHAPELLLLDGSRRGTAELG